MGKYIKRLISLIDEADNGNTDAMLEFIMTTAVSTELSSVPMIKEKCNFYVEKLVKRGNPAGFILAGDRFRTGDGIERSIEKAVAYYYLAANSGDTFGYELIAQMHIEGVGLPINYEIAYEFLKKSEDTNNGRMRSDSGYYFMGEVYYFGLSVPQDWEKAKGYYLKVVEIYGTGDFYWKACERISTMSTYVLECL